MCMKGARSLEKVATDESHPAAVIRERWWLTSGAMGGGGNVMIFASLLVGIIAFMWMASPTEQTLLVQFPNVMIVRGFGHDKLDPISFDNTTLPELSAADAWWLNGFYQFDHLFYHKTFDRLIPWEEKHDTMVWSCAIGCRPMNSSAPDVRLILIHTKKDEKKSLWYLVELHDDDVNSPILLARSKFRSKSTWNVPWMTVTPGGDVKPRELKDVYVVTAWDAFKFDTPIKWAFTVVIVIISGILFWRRRRSDDDDD